MQDSSAVHLSSCLVQLEACVLRSGRCFFFLWFCNHAQRQATKAGKRADYRTNPQCADTRNPAPRGCAHPHGLDAAQRKDFAQWSGELRHVKPRARICSPGMDPRDSLRRPHGHHHGARRARLEGAQVGATNQEGMRAKEKQNEFKQTRMPSWMLPTTEVCAPADTLVTSQTPGK